MTAHAASHVYFGLDPMWVSTGILAITYAMIMSEKVNRAIVALTGAGVMIVIVIGVLEQEEAIKGVDWNTLGLLTGMMILVSVSRRSGMFEFVAMWSARAAKAHPAGIMLMLADRHRGALRLSRQRHHRAVDRAGDARHLRHAEGPGLPLFIRAKSSPPISAAPPR